MLSTRDVPVTGYFTKTSRQTEPNKKDFYFDVGIGHTDFVLTVTPLQGYAKNKIQIDYNGTLLADTDFVSELLYVVGSVDTDDATQYANFIKVNVEVQYRTAQFIWLYLVNLELSCDENSPAPKPYKVTINTTGTALRKTIPKPDWIVFPEPPVFRDPNQPPPDFSNFDPSPINPAFPVVVTIDPGSVSGGADSGGGPSPPGVPGSGSGSGGIVETEPTPGTDVDMPLPEDPIVDQPAPETTEVITTPLSLTVNAYSIVAGQWSDREITDTNSLYLLGNTVLSRTDSTKSFSYVDITKTEVSATTYAAKIVAKASGGSKKYRFKFKNIFPGQRVFRRLKSENSLPSDEGVQQVSSVYGENSLYIDNFTYQSDDEMVFIPYDNTVRCYGMNEPNTQLLTIEVDDGYETVTQDITLFKESLGISIDTSIDTAIYYGSSPLLINEVQPNIQYKLRSGDGPQSVNLYESDGTAFAMHYGISYEHYYYWTYTYYNQLVFYIGIPSFLNSASNIINFEFEDFDDDYFVRIPRTDDYSTSGYASGWYDRKLSLLFNLKLGVKERNFNKKAVVIRKNLFVEDGESYSQFIMPSAEWRHLAGNFDFMAFAHYDAGSNAYWRARGMYGPIPLAVIRVVSYNVDTQKKTTIAKIPAWFVNGNSGNKGVGFPKVPSFYTGVVNTDRYSGGGIYNL